MAVLAHESIHLFDNTAGKSIDLMGATAQERESRADCLGMQNIARVAVALGDTPEGASALARYYVLVIYPGRQASSPDYWTADCVPNGRLDLAPGDGIWP
jgi:hypothetical protein